MADERVQRRLAAILAADVVGYSRMMREDETGTRARFNAHLNELIEPTIASYRLLYPQSLYLTPDSSVHLLAV